MAKKITYEGLFYPDFIEVGEEANEKHRIAMPPLPEDPAEVFFINETEENAYWNRDKILKKDYRDIWFKFIPNETLVYRSTTEFDDDGFATQLNKEDSDYIVFCYEREMKRRTHGVFVRMGNTIEWLTGDHWFCLMWAKTKRPDKKGDYFDYREYQRDFYYIINHVNKSLIIPGAFWSKAKKTGITNLMWIYYLNKSTMTRNINLGCMNIDQAKAAKTFVDHFMYAFNGLPLALKPEIKSYSSVDGKISFGKRYIGKQNRRLVNDEELNTTVMCVATALNAFDVDVFTDIWYDEPPKYKTDFGAIYRSNMGGTKIQDFLVGRQWMTSYTPEQAGDSFKSAKQIFYDSELKTITPHSEGKTKSGLICYHIPAFKSWATSFNKFGKCNEIEAKVKIQTELDLLKDRPNEFLKKKRELANTKKDAWSVGDSTAVFDPIRLSELEYDLDELQRSKPTFEWGHLEWANALWEIGKKDKRPKGVFDRVIWVPLSAEDVAKGKTDKMRRYHKINPQDENMAIQQGKDEYGNLRPPIRHPQTWGIDPADFRDAGNAEEGSLISMHSMIVHNPMLNSLSRSVASGILCLEYLERPDNPEEWYQDIVKFIIYTAGIGIIEANNGTIATRLEDEGLGFYMLFKNSEGVIVPYKANHKNISAEQGGNLRHIKNVKSGGVDTVADLIMVIKKYLQRASKEHGEIDYGETLRSERLIKQLKNFDSYDTKPFDLVMSFGYCDLAHEIYLALLSAPPLEGYPANEINSVLNALLRVH